MQDLQIIDERAAATALLEPLRAKVLAALVEPGSASTVSKQLGESRQKINYHLRALEEQQLIELVAEVPRRGLTERIVRASAKSFVLSPELLGGQNPEPDRTDRMSSNYLVAVATRLLRELALLIKLADEDDKSLPTLTIDTEIKFRSARERAEFTQELSDAISTIAARHHDESAPNGRWHRLVVAAHPLPPQSKAQPPTERRV